MIDFDTPGTVIKQDMIEAGKFIGDILILVSFGCIKPAFVLIHVSFLLHTFKV